MMCINCNEDNALYSNYCLNDGEDLQNIKNKYILKRQGLNNCTQCGAKLFNASNYCHECGESLSFIDINKL